MAATYGHRAGGPLDGLKHALTRTVFRRATALVTWSAWAKRSLVNDYAIPPDRVTVIPPGTDLRLWATERAPDSTATPRVLFVGGDLSRKGGYDLIEACAPLLPDQCELHIVTRVPLPARPGLFVYNDIEPNSPALRRLYAQADIFALPTYGDCLPLVLVEAMAAGLPVVATPIAGVPEVVEPGRTGYLVQPGDVANLRSALMTLIASPALRHRLGRAARVRAEQRFDARLNATRLRDLLLAIAADTQEHRRRVA
jgi:glycosyltransferase involved in cell wall biosynthesis